jgi:cytochrome b subunit of formate dehydrogenase
MNHYEDITQGKSLSELGSEAFWFFAHTALAVFFLYLALAGMTMTHPDPDATEPKLMGTALAFLIPMLGGYLIAKCQQNTVARYVWISGIVFFSIVCVWVLDLPTGPGLCEKCGAMEKLWRTFFDIEHGSGLMAGDGLLVGAWVPLSMISYAIGASFALRSET